MQKIKPDFLPKKYCLYTKAHTHENKEVLDGITSDKVTAWDNKSEFSGSYNDLNDKPTIDAELSNTSENTVQNKVITNAINGKQDVLLDTVSGVKAKFTLENGIICVREI